MINFSRHYTMTFSGYCMLKTLRKEDLNSHAYLKLSWATLCSKNWLFNLSRSSRPKMLLISGVPEISQNLQENACAGVSLSKVAGWQPETLLKKRLSRVFSREFSRIFKNTFFYRHFQATASFCYFMSGKWWTFKKNCIFC